MASPGRPPAERKTDQTRAWADQVEKLQWLYRLRGTKSAEFIGPLIEDKLNEAYESIRPIVEQLAADDPAFANALEPEAK